MQKVAIWILGEIRLKRFNQVHAFCRLFEEEEHGRKWIFNRVTPHAEPFWLHATNVTTLINLCFRKWFWMRSWTNAWTSLLVQWSGTGWQGLKMWWQAGIHRYFVSFRTTYSPQGGPNLIIWWLEIQRFRCTVKLREFAGDCPGAGKVAQDFWEHCAGCRQDAALSRAEELKKKAALQHPKLQCKLREVRFVKEKVAIVDQHPCVPA